MIERNIRDKNWTQRRKQENEDKKQMCAWTTFSFDVFYLFYNAMKTYWRLEKSRETKL